MKRTLATLGIMSALALSAATPAAAAPAEKIDICHATGSETNPYVRISISLNGLNGHADHGDDIIPPNSFLPAGLNFDASGESTYGNGCVPVDGPTQGEGQLDPEKPVTPEQPVNPGPEKIDICHATGSEANPYVRISISLNGLNGHADHGDDIIPPNSFLPAGLNFDASGESTYGNGCVPVDGPTQGEGQLDPEKPVTPEQPVNPGPEKIDICHATGSETNPYVRISISLNGLNGHADHGDDIIPPNSFLPAGLNFDASGESTYGNGCVPVDGPTQGEGQLDPEKPVTPEQPVVSPDGIEGQMGLGLSGKIDPSVSGGKLDLQSSGEVAQQRPAFGVGGTNEGLNLQTAAGESESSGLAPWLYGGLVASSVIAGLWAARMKVLR